LLLPQAGLFSAVVATFVTQTTQLLQRDNSEVTASLLTELVGLQRAIGTGGNVSAIQESSLTSNTAFKPTLRDVWLNGLWLASLALTLMTALITGLIKQWLNYYISDTPGSPKHRACIRQFRFKGVAAWGVHPFIELLPVLMNTSLLLFFVGLILFSQDLIDSKGTTAAIVIITCVSFAFYLVTSTLPIFWPQCPYKTSLTSLVYVPYLLAWCFLRTAKLLVKLLMLVCFYIPIRCLCAPRSEAAILDTMFSFVLEAIEEIQKIVRIVQRARVSLPQGEASRVKDEGGALEMNIIEEMVLHSPHPVVSSIAAQALAALSLNEPFTQDEASDALWKRIDQIFTQSFARTGISITAGKEYELLEPHSTIERLARALVYYPLHISSTASDRLTAFMSMDLEDIRLAAIQAFVLWHDVPISPPSHRGPAITCVALTRRFLESKDIETSRLHPWQRRHLSQVAAFTSKTKSYSPDDREAFLQDLLGKLDLDNPPLLQQELLISLLSPETVLDPDTQSPLVRFPFWCMLNSCLRPLSH
jgi:hypothetical protein